MKTIDNKDPGSSRAELHLVVLVPCLNEAKTIGAVIEAIPREMAGIGSVDVLVIDDGSTDKTSEIARRAGAVVLRHSENLGLGVSFRDGVHRALELGADILVNIDGDGQFNPGDIPRLIAGVLAGEAHMVTASRFLDPAMVPKMPRIKRWGNTWVAWIVGLISGKKFRDVSCGFRAFSREALLQMNLFGSFTYTQETFLDLLFKGLGITEIPLPVRGTREFGESRMASSIPRYAVRSFKIMLRAAIGYRPFRFFATLATLFLAVGFGLLGFLVWHYSRTSAFSPHIWAGFVGGSFAFLGLSTLVLGFVGDILVRMRMNQEKVLYLLVRQRYSLSDEGTTRDEEPSPSRT